MIACLCALGAVLSGGCHLDSFLDPSVLGRWEATPTVVPVLERIAAIEQGSGELVEFTEPTPEDLIPAEEAFDIGPGDALQIRVFDLFVTGQPETFQRTVDPNGFVQIPQGVGPVRVEGLDESAAAREIERAMRRLVADPRADVVILQRREQSFVLQGNIPQPGAYQIPTRDYRLLEAIVTAGGINAATSSQVFIIRQVRLTESGEEQPRQGAAPAEGTPPVGLPPQREEEQPSGEDLLDVIEELTGERPEDGGADPAVFSGANFSVPGERRAAASSSGRASFARSSALQPSQRQEPIVDLFEPPGGQDRAGGSGSTGRWVFLNGRWVQTSESAARQAAAAPEEGAGDVEGAVSTQRVIRVPTRELLAGDSRFNIVVRPNDVIRVPPPEVGNVYVAGQVARPGVYALPAVGRLTLTRAITAAGGLGAIAIPERVDLTRMVGPDRQATIMLNLRAIAEGTQPDVFMKPDDHVNVGTNFFALPLAVIRGGFRTNYGFGFLLDRNFGNDVFGAPPVNFGGG